MLLSARRVMLLLAVALVVLPAGCAPSINLNPNVSLPWGESSVRIPLVWAGNHLLMPVKINGKDAGLWVVDTGASANCISQAMAEKLGLSSGRTVNVNAISDWCSPDTYSVFKLSANGITIGWHTLIGLDLSAFEAIGADGVLGGQLFQGRPFTIDPDFDNPSITFYGRHSFQPPQGAYEEYCEVGSNVPYVLASMGSDKYMGAVMIDTGSSGGIDLDRPSVKSIIDKPIFVETCTAAGKSYRVVAQMNSFTVFGEKLQNKIALFPYEQASFNTLEWNSDNEPITKDYIGLIGEAFLRNYQLTFDYKARRLWTKKVQKQSPEQLIAAGKDLNKTDSIGTTRLMVAVMMYDLDYLKQLLDAGADYSICNKEGYDALTMACSEGDKEIIAALLAAGVDPVNNAYPIYAAVSVNDIETIKMLLAAGAKLDTIDENGATPLMLAAQNGWPQSAEFLIKNGADVNHADNAKFTPLIIAAKHGNPVVLKLLLEAGAKVGAKTDDGDDALLWACSMGHCNCMRILMHYGADPQVKNKRGVSPLIAAAKISILYKNHALQIILAEFYNPTDEARKEWSDVVENPLLTPFCPDIPEHMDPELAPLMIKLVKDAYATIHEGGRYINTDTTDILLEAIGKTNEKRAIPHLLEMLENSKVEKNPEYPDKVIILAALLALTGQDIDGYGLEHHVCHGYSLKKEQDWNTSYKLFEKWWAEAKSTEQYRDLQPLVLPELPK